MCCHHMNVRGRIFAFPKIIFFWFRFVSQQTLRENIARNAGMILIGARFFSRIVCWKANHSIALWIGSQSLVKHKTRGSCYKSRSEKFSAVQSYFKLQTLCCQLKNKTKQNNDSAVKQFESRRQVRNRGGQVIVEAMLFYQKNFTKPGKCSPRMCQEFHEGHVSLWVHSECEIQKHIYTCY